MGLSALASGVKRSNRSKLAGRIIRRAAAIEMLESRTLLSGSAQLKPNGIPLTTPTISTTPSTTKITLGTTQPSVSDTADLENGSDPTGTISFALSGGQLLGPTTKTVNGNGKYTSDPLELNTFGPVAGVYTWNVMYSGDEENAQVSELTGESLEVDMASPTIVTTPSSTNVTLGPVNVPMQDSATLSGGYFEEGEITFTLYDSSNTKVDSETAFVDGNGTYSTDFGYMPTAAGTYQWDASYTGDDNNNPVSEDNNSAEQVTVAKASPTLETSPEISSVTLGSFNLPLQDSATLSDGSNETGSITFTLYDPSNTAVDTETVPVSGNGEYFTSSGYTPTAAGTYQWDASYSGDDSNNAVSESNNKDEQVVVTAATPLLSTEPDPYTTPLNSGSTTLTDTAELLEGDDPTGSITFTLYDPSNTKVDTETVTVMDGGQYTTPTGYSVPDDGAGTYQWDASYSGDSANNPVSENDNPLEKVTVTIPSGSNSISGTKYTDLTGNGFSNDDTPLSGVTIDLFYNGASTPTETTTTATDGTYSFGDLGDGSYVVKEEVPTGYTQTGGASGYTVSLSQGQSSTGNNFDDFKNISISGVKYKDLTDNGFSNDDTPLSGVTIKLSVFDVIAYFPLESTTTAADGSYSFTNLGPGDYLVNETVPTGYTQTGGVGGYDVAAISGQNSTGNNFDDFQNPPADSTICGTKYQDITGNGITSDDTPLSGVTIQLFENGGSTPVATTTTAANGSYSFTGLAPATYKVVESVPSGWTQTVGSSGYTVIANGSSTYSGKNFADFKDINITGTKFTDLTGNGFSTDDTLLKGVTIQLWKNSNSTVYRTTTTASDGTYKFTNLGPGTYKVKEVVPSGYVQTGGGPNGSAGKAYYTISAESADNITGDNFDDYKIPTCKPKNVYFTINHGSKKYTTLTNNTQKGETVTVTFTVPSGMDDELTLVSYSSPNPTFNNSTAYKQTIYQQATGTFAPGTHSLTITIPNKYYQIDFVCGPAISQIIPPGAGPDSQNIIYSAEDRLISTDT